MKKLAALFITGLVLGSLATYYLKPEPDIKETDYVNISDLKQYNPRFSICHIKDFNETGYFYADNLTECKNMQPDKFAY